MAKLTAQARNALPAAAFAGPNRSFPVEDKGHAVAAKGRASQQVKAGNLAPATATKIKKKANKVLGKGAAPPFTKKAAAAADPMAATTAQGFQKMPWKG